MMRAGRRHGIWPALGAVFLLVVLAAALSLALPRQPGGGGGGGAEQPTRTPVITDAIIGRQMDGCPPGYIDKGGREIPTWGGTQKMRLCTQVRTLEELGGTDEIIVAASLRVHGGENSDCPPGSRQTCNRVNRACAGGNQKLCVTPKAVDDLQPTDRRFADLEVHVQIADGSCQRNCVHVCTAGCPAGWDPPLKIPTTTLYVNVWSTICDTTCLAPAGTPGGDTNENFCRAPQGQPGWDWEASVHQQNPGNACCGNSPDDLGFISNDNLWLCVKEGPNFEWKRVGTDVRGKIRSITIEGRPIDVVNALNRKYAVCDPGRTLPERYFEMGEFEGLPPTPPPDQPAPEGSCLQAFTQRFSACQPAWPAFGQCGALGNSDWEIGNYCCENADRNDVNDCVCYGDRHERVYLTTQCPGSQPGGGGGGGDCRQDGATCNCPLLNCIDDPGLNAGELCREMRPQQPGYVTALCEAPRECRGQRVRSRDTNETHVCCYGQAQNPQALCAAPGDQPGCAQGRVCSANEYCDVAPVGTCCPGGQCRPLATEPGREHAFMCHTWNGQENEGYIKECCEYLNCANPLWRGTMAGGLLQDIHNYNTPLANANDAVIGSKDTQLILVGRRSDGSERTEYPISIPDLQAYAHDWRGFSTLEFRIGYRTPDFLQDVYLVPTSGARVNVGPLERFIVGGTGTGLWHRVLVPLHGPATAGLDLANMDGITLTRKPGSNPATLVVDNVRLLSPDPGRHRYCAGRAGQWVDDLDPPAGATPAQKKLAEIACIGEAFEDTSRYVPTGTDWTGSFCCGDDAAILQAGSPPQGEYFADTLKGCFDSMPVEMNTPVSVALNDPAAPSSILYASDGHFHACKALPNPVPRKTSPSDVTQDLGTLISQDKVDSVCAQWGDYHCANGGTYKHNSEAAAFADPASPTGRSKCMGGQAVAVGTKYDWNQMLSGECPDDRCFCPTANVPPQYQSEYAPCGTDSDVQGQCAEKGGLVGAHYCQARTPPEGGATVADWTTIGPLLAAHLLKLVHEENDYWLWCDEPALAANELPPSTDVKALAPVLCTLRLTSGPSQKTILAAALAGETPQDGIDKIINPHVERHGSPRFPLTACDGKDATTGKPQECATAPMKLYYEPKLRLLFVSTDTVADWADLNVFERVWHALRRLLRPAGPNANIPLPSNFERLFLAKQHGREVRGYTDSTWRNQEIVPIMKLEYTNFETDLMSVPDLVSPSVPSGYAFEAVTELIGPTQHLLLYNHPDLRLSDTHQQPAIWPKFTAQLRLPDTPPAQTLPFTCPNGVLEAGEDCESGNTIRAGAAGGTCVCNLEFPDACTCKREAVRCGNGVVDGRDECDGRDEPCPDASDYCGPNPDGAPGFYDHRNDGFDRVVLSGRCDNAACRCTLEDPAWLQPTWHDAGFDGPADADTLSDYCQHCDHGSDGVCNCGETPGRNPAECADPLAPQDINGGFEQFPAGAPVIANGWNDEGGSAGLGNIRDVSRKQSGDASLKVVTHPDMEILGQSIRRWVSLEPHRRYRFEAAVFQPPHPAGQNCGSAAIRLEWGGWAFKDFRTTQTDQWEVLSWTFTNLPGGDGFWIKLMPECLEGNPPTWFDSLKLTPLPETALIINGGFEEGPDPYSAAWGWPDKIKELENVRGFTVDSVFFPIPFVGLFTAHTGRYFLRPTGKTGILTEQILQPGPGRYRATAWAYMNSGCSPAPRFFVSVGGVPTSDQELVPRRTRNWEKLETVFTVQNDVERVRLAIWHRCANFIGVGWDDISLEKLS